MKEKRVIILRILFVVLLMAVTAVALNYRLAVQSRMTSTAEALNRRAVLQSRMAINQTQAVKTSLGQMMTLERAIWELTRDPCWRTGASVYSLDGSDYTLTVSDSNLSGYRDAVILSVTAPGAANGIKTAFRYFLTDFPYGSAPNHVSRDAHNNRTIAGRDSRTTQNVDGFNRPSHIAMDPIGNIFIADSGNHRIRKLIPSGEVTTVAGTGIAGSSGNNGPATSAELNQPQGVAVDGSGNIYIADTGNGWIRKVDIRTGIISIVAGTSTPGVPDGDDSGDDGPATSAGLKKTRGVHVDSSGNIYIADTGNCLIRKVYTSGSKAGKIFTVAGKTGQCGYDGDDKPATSASLNKPKGVFADGAGNVYIADTDNHRIRKVDVVGKITTVAGTGQDGYSGDGGPATHARIKKPNSVFLDSAGNLFIASENHLIRVVSRHDQKIRTLAGTGAPGYNGGDRPAVEAQLHSPFGVALHTVRGGRKIYISDRDNHRIRVLTLTIEKRL